MRNALVLRAAVIATGLLLSFAGAFPVYASSTMYSQTISTGTTSPLKNTSPSVTLTQRVNDYGIYDLTGVMDEFSVMYELIQTATTSVTIPYQWVDGTNFLCTGNISIPAGSSAGTHQIFIPCSVTFDPTDGSKQHAFRFNVNSDPGVSNIRFRGSPTDTYGGGNCQGSTVSCNTAYDLFFILNGIQTSSDTSYTSSLSPTQASTTATTQVRYSFNYHAAAAQNINSYAVFFRDDTTGTTIGPITGSASSGDHNVSNTITLTALHRYTWQAYICNSSGTCYGGPAPFFWVQGNGGFLLSSISGSTTPGVINYEQYYDYTQINEGNASSSLSSTIGSFFNLPALLSDRVPFGWIYQIRDAYDEALASSTGSDPGSVILDFGSADLSTSTRAILPEPITLFSTSTVTEYFPPTALAALNLLVSASLYLLFGGYVFRKVSVMFV